MSDFNENKKKGINHALIMAAGRGSRMMPLTNSKPKALVEFEGEALISYGIKEMKKNIQNVHVTVGYKKSMLAKYLIENDVSSIINTEGRGNCWWLFNSFLKLLNEPILVLTCDNIVEIDISRVLEDYFMFNEPACMVIPVSPVLGLEGDYIFHKDHKVFKLSRTEINDSYCSGIQILNPYKVNTLFNKVENFNELWEQMMITGQLFCSRIYPEKWISFDSQEHLSMYKKL